MIISILALIVGIPVLIVEFKIIQHYENKCRRDYQSEQAGSYDTERSNQEMLDIAIRAVL